MTRHQREACFLWMKWSKRKKSEGLESDAHAVSSFFPCSEKKKTDGQEAEKKLKSVSPWANDNPETDQMNTKNHKLKRRIKRKSRNPKWGFFVDNPIWANDNPICMLCKKF